MLKAPVLEKGVLSPPHWTLRSAWLSCGSSTCLRPPLLLIDRGSGDGSVCSQGQLQDEGQGSILFPQGK